MSAIVVTCRSVPLSGWRFRRSNANFRKNLLPSTPYRNTLYRAGADGGGLVVLEEGLLPEEVALEEVPDEDAVRGDLRARLLRDFEQAPELYC